MAAKQTTPVGLRPKQVVEEAVEVGFEELRGSGVGWEFGGRVAGFALHVEHDQAVFVRAKLQGLDRIFSTRSGAHGWKESRPDASRISPNGGPDAGIGKPRKDTNRGGGKGISRDRAQRTQRGDF